MLNGCGNSANRWASASILHRWRSTTARQYPRPASAPRWRRAVWRTPTRCSAHPYAIDWPVVHGKGIGGGLLGTPTLNQNYPAAALQPCAGVYLTRILSGRAVAACGNRHRQAPHGGQQRGRRCDLRDIRAGLMRGTSTAGSRCWNFTSITAPSASSTPWRSWPP